MNTGSVQKALLEPPWWWRRLLLPMLRLSVQVCRLHTTGTSTLNSRRSVISEHGCHCSAWQCVLSAPLLIDGVLRNSHSACLAKPLVWMPWEAGVHRPTNSSHLNEMAFKSFHTELSISPKERSESLWSSQACRQILCLDHYISFP